MYPAAGASGLLSRFIFKSEKAGYYLSELEIPDGYVPLYALALGYAQGENPEPTPRKEDCINYIR